MHTPGPWSCNGGSYIGICAMVDGVRRQIGRAEIVGTPGVMSSEECEANAALMEAAPDLLDALKEARDTIAILHGPAGLAIYLKNAPEMKRLDAAIAKAEGK